MAEIVATYVVAVDLNGDARANVQPHTSPLPTMIVCVMSDQTVQRPPVIADGCVTQSVMVSVCDTQGTSGPNLCFH